MTNPNTPNPAPQVPNAPVTGGEVPFYQPTTPSANVEADVVAPQVIEKIVYKKQRIHWFFRTLTIIALLVVGILMLLEVTGVLKLSINNFNLDIAYAIFIVFSSIIIRSYKGLFGKIFWLILFLGVVGGFFGINIYTSLNQSTKSKFGDYVSYTTPSWDNSWIILSDIRVNTLIGNLEIQGKEIDNLAEWTYKSDRNLIVDSGIKNNYDYLILQEDTNWNLLQNVTSDLTLWISDSRIVNLYLKNMYGVHNVDLSDIRWFNAKIHGGVQDLTVSLWDKTFRDSELDIQLVGGKITLYVPKEIGVQLYFKQLAGSLELTDFDVKEDKYFESKNIKTASKVVKININSGISRFKLLWE